MSPKARFRKVKHGSVIKYNYRLSGRAVNKLPVALPRRAAQLWR
jgi:hypothetical protein